MSAVLRRLAALVCLTCGQPLFGYHDCPGRPTRNTASIR